MKASYLGAMGYSQRHNFPATWPIPPIYHDPEIPAWSNQEGLKNAMCASPYQVFSWSTRAPMYKPAAIT